MNFSANTQSRVEKREIIDMAIRKFFIFSTFVFLTILASASFASDKVPLRAQDRVEIENLMWEYIRALDSHNAEAFVTMFTPDGQFGRGKSVVKGRKALKKMVVDAWQKMDSDNKGDKKKPRMYHIVTNPHIVFIDKDHAHYHAYWMGVLETGEIVAAGREVNELVRINERWLISLRDVEPDD
jgi:uncharacterized protein (TIGR02246 family)